MCLHVQVPECYGHVTCLLPQPVFRWLMAPNKHSVRQRAASLSGWVAGNILVRRAAVRGRLTEVRRSHGTSGTLLPLLTLIIGPASRNGIGYRRL